MVELALAEDEAAEDQEAAGGALDGDAPLHRRVVARGHRPHGDGALLQAVDPATVAEPHLEDGRLREELPAGAASIRIRSPPERVML